MSEIRGDDALGHVPFEVNNPAFASGAGSTRAAGIVEPVVEEVEEPLEAQTEPDEDALEPDEDESDEDDLAGHTIPELKEMLREEGLPVSGNKDDLIARLEDAEGDEDSDGSGGEA